MTKKLSKSRARELKKRGFSQGQFTLYVLAFAMVGAISLWLSFAAAPTACIQGTPGVRTLSNTATGVPGHQVTYQVLITNYDISCASSRFSLSASVPAGFKVNYPVSSVSLRSGASSIMTVYVTWPATGAGSASPINFSAVRS